MDLAATTHANKFVTLAPLSEAHRAALAAHADRDPGLFRHMPAIAMQGGFANWFDWVLFEHAAGRWIAHAVLDPNGQAVGQTAYMAIRKTDRGVEIGGTWYVPQAQATAINPSAKLLLLGYAFVRGAERVELKTDANNARSRAAILKLGASFEGIHRHHMLRADGTWRDTAWFSILREEWPVVREKLEARLAAF